MPEGKYFVTDGGKRDNLYGEIEVKGKSRKKESRK